VGVQGDSSAYGEGAEWPFQKISSTWWIRRFSEKGARSVSLPVGALTVLGILITVLGLFAGGEVGLVIIGLVSIAVAGLLHVFGTRRYRT
jgi:hypothetical protein